MRDADEDRGITPPEPTIEAGVREFLRAVASDIPLPLSTAFAVWEMRFPSPFTKRLIEWNQHVYRELRRLHAELDGKALSEDEAFVSTVYRTTEMAMRDHQKEKLEALRNALLNTAIGKAPHDDLRLMFLNMIDMMTPWHIRLLDFYRDPLEWVQTRNITPPAQQTLRPKVAGQGVTVVYGSEGPDVTRFVDVFFPDFEDGVDVFRHIQSELTDKGLLRTHHQAIGLYPQGTDIWTACSLSSMGKMFLDFITSPIEPEKSDNE